MADFNKEQNQIIRTNISILRELNKVPNNVLCSKLYVSERSLYRLFSGETDWDMKKVESAAEVFKVDPKEIIGAKGVSIEAFDQGNASKEGCAKAVIYIISYLSTLPDEQSIKEMLDINNRITTNTFSNMLNK